MHLYLKTETVFADVHSYVYYYSRFYDYVGLSLIAITCADFKWSGSISGAVSWKHMVRTGHRLPLRVHISNIVNMKISLAVLWRTGWRGSKGQRSQRSQMNRQKGGEYNPGLLAPGQIFRLSDCSIYGPSPTNLICLMNIIKQIEFIVNISLKLSSNSVEIRFISSLPEWNRALLVVAAGRFVCWFISDDQRHAINLETCSLRLLYSSVKKKSTVFH